MFRENRVPYYQRLFQQHDGKRQWYKVSTRRKGHMPSMKFPEEQETDIGIVSQTSRSGYVMYPYLISVYGLGAGE